MEARSFSSVRKRSPTNLFLAFSIDTTSGCYLTPGPPKSPPAGGPPKVLQNIRETNYASIVPIFNFLHVISEPSLSARSSLNKSNFSTFFSSRIASVWISIGSVTSNMNGVRSFTKSTLLPSSVREKSFFVSLAVLTPYDTAI